MNLYINGEFAVHNKDNASSEELNYSSTAKYLSGVPCNLHDSDEEDLTTFNGAFLLLPDPETTEVDLSSDSEESVIISNHNEEELREEAISNLLLSQEAVFLIKIGISREYLKELGEKDISLLEYITNPNKFSRIKYLMYCFGHKGISPVDTFNNLIRIAHIDKYTLTCLLENSHAILTLAEASTPISLEQLADLANSNHEVLYRTIYSYQKLLKFIDTQPSIGFEQLTSLNSYTYSDVLLYFALDNRNKRISYDMFLKLHESSPTLIPQVLREYNKSSLLKLLNEPLEKSTLRGDIYKERLYSYTQDRSYVLNKILFSEEINMLMDIAALELSKNPNNSSLLEVADMTVISFYNENPLLWGLLLFYRDEVMYLLQNTSPPIGLDDLLTIGRVEMRALELALSNMEKIIAFRENKISTLKEGEYYNDASSILELYLIHGDSFVKRINVIDGTVATVTIPISRKERARSLSQEWCEPPMSYDSLGQLYNFTHSTTLSTKKKAARIADEICYNDGGKESLAELSARALERNTMKEEDYSSAALRRISNNTRARSYSFSL